MNQIVDFRAGTDDRFPCLRSIDTGIRADFDIIANDDSSEVRNFL